MNKILSIIIKLGISALLVGLIIRYVGWASILGSLKTFNFLWLIPALFFWIASYFLNAANLYVLINMEAKMISFWDVLRFYCISMGISFFIPGLIGQASIIPLIKKDTKSFSKSTGIFLLDRAWVLIVVMFGAVIGSYIFLEKDKAHLFLALAIMLGGTYVFLFLTGVGNRLSIKILRPLVPGRFKEKFDTITSLFSDYSKSKNTIYKNVIFSVLRWVAKALFFFSLFMGFGVYVSPIFTFSVGAWEALVALIPISLAGLGLREGTGLFFYGKLGLPIAVIGAMYFITNLFIYITGLLSFLLIKKEDLSWSALFAKEKK